MESRKARDRVFNLFDRKVAHICSRELLVNVYRLREATDQLLKWAPEYDYSETTPGNGYSSFAKLLVKFVDLVVASFLRKKSRAAQKSLLAVSRYLLVLWGYLNKVHEGSALEKADSNLGPCLFNPSENLVRYMLSKDAHNREDLTTLYGHHSCFWLCPSMRTAIRRCQFFTALMSSSFWSVLKVIVNKDFQAKVFTEFAQNTGIGFVKQLWSVTEWKAFKSIVPTLMYPLSPNIVKTIHVPRLNEWLIHPFTGDVIKDRVNLVYEKNYVRCRFIQNGVFGKSPNDSLVLHCHGAAFVAQSPDSHETYLRDWASKLEGTPILSVDYSLSPENKWPAAVQDTLDVYLWLTSRGPQIKRQLGFFPKNIVLCGDSAGGVLVLNLLNVLNDIKTLVFLGKYEISMPIVMPLAVVCCYPITVTQVIMSPSRLMVHCDSLIPSGVLLSSIEAYLFNIEDLIYRCRDVTPSIGLIDDVKQTIASPFRVILNTFYGVTRRLFGYPHDEGPWYRQLPCMVKKKLTQINKRAQHPYASPLNYENFEAFQDISLHLVVGEFDAFLDDSVSLAKKWKGPVTLDILEDLSHGFLYFNYLSNEAKDASNLCVTRLKKALSLGHKF